MAEALSDSLYIQKLITEMRTGEIQHFGEILPLTMYTDHQGLHLSVKEQPNVENGKVQVDLAIVREDLRRGWLCALKWISSEYQIADCLTKKGARADLLMRVMTTGRGFSKVMEASKD